MASGSMIAHTVRGPLQCRTVSVACVARQMMPNQIFSLMRSGPPCVQIPPIRSEVAFSLLLARSHCRCRQSGWTRSTHGTKPSGGTEKRRQ